RWCWLRPELPFLEPDRSLASPMNARFPVRGRGPRALAAAIALCAMAATACSAGQASQRTGGSAQPAPSASSSAASAATDRQLALARHKIKHVVFLIKENRTFDTMFGRFPGADGATTGRKCGSASPVKLTLAAD